MLSRFLGALDEDAAVATALASAFVETLSTKSVAGAYAGVDTLHGQTTDFPSYIRLSLEQLFVWLISDGFASYNSLG